MYIMEETKTIFYSWKEIDDKLMEQTEKILFSENWKVGNACNCQNGIKVKYSR